MARQSVLLLVALLIAMATAVLAGPGPLVDNVQTRGELTIVLERRQDNNGTSPTPSVDPTTASPSLPPVTTSTSRSTLPTPSQTTPTTSPDPTTNEPTTKPTTPASKTSDKTTEPPITSVKTTLSPTTRQSNTVETSKSGDQDVIVTRTTFFTETPVIEVPVTSGKKESLSGESSSDSGSSGLDTKQKNIVIGVCVGVGGAILLGALGIVLFRYRKKRVNPVDEDDLMRRDGSPLAGGKEGSDTSPFQATLDQYHRQPINTSSNF